MNEESTPPGQLLIYRDGSLNLQVRLDGQTVWLTQAQLAELYQTSKQNISLHIQNILDDKELPPNAVVKEYLTTAADGKNYRTLHYSLDIILAVGYRVRSPRGTIFRQWATSRLRELLVKGFTLDDERIKAGRTIGADYFDELLARIRDIRASERLARGGGNGMSLQASFTLRGRNPDVLTCIANLSNDEVFTPPEFANRMLDMLAGWGKCFANHVAFSIHV